MRIARRHRLPIMGAVIKREPLTGAKGNPIRLVPLSEIVEDLMPKVAAVSEKTGEEAMVPEFGSYSYVCLEYNIDEEWCEIELKASEEFHNWLAGILPQLRNVQEAKNWKLDKSGMMEE